MQQKNSDLQVANVSLTMNEGEANAVAIRKGNEDLKAVVDKVIQKLKMREPIKLILKKLLN